MGVYRIGFVGAGPATQSIHLPTLALLGHLGGSDTARVTHIMDPDESIAQAVAGPLGAKASTSLDDLLADGVDIAVVASPNRFHAEQITALCAAGVAAILAEKPLATSLDEVERVAQAVRSASTALVVGAMHLYDPAWLAAYPQMVAAGGYQARCAVYIPANSHFEDMATTMVRPAAAGGGQAPTPADIIHGGVLGLAIHDLPLIRRFIPRVEEVVVAEALAPWGYVLTATGPAGSVELLARTGGTWRPDWTLDVWGGDARLELSFPPSYVHAGSASASLSLGPDDASPSLSFGPYADDGYLAEWRELFAILAGASPRYGLDDVVADIDYAIRLADLAAARVNQAQGA